MHIGIDIDNTLADLSRAAWDYYNSLRPLDQFVPLSMFQTWSAGSSLGLSNTEFFALLDKTWQRWAPYMRLIEHDAAETIGQLRDAGHTIHIISNRSRNTHKYVAAFLRYEAIPYDVLTLIDMGKVEKLEFPIDVLIDDHPNLVDRARQYPDKTVLLYNQPWNADCNAEGNVHRIVSLHGAAIRISSMSS